MPRQVTPVARDPELQAVEFKAGLLKREVDAANARCEGMARQLASERAHHEQARVMLLAAARQQPAAAAPAVPGGCGAELRQEERDRLGDFMSARFRLA